MAERPRATSCAARGCCSARSARGAQASEALRAAGGACRGALTRVPSLAAGRFLQRVQRKLGRLDYERRSQSR